MDGSLPSSAVSSFKMTGAGVVVGPKGVRVGGGAITGVATADTAGRPCGVPMGQAKPKCVYRSGRRRRPDTAFLPDTKSLERRV